MLTTPFDVRRMTACCSTSAQFLLTAAYAAISTFSAVHVHQRGKDLARQVKADLRLLAAEAKKGRQVCSIGRAAQLKGGTCATRNNHPPASQCTCQRLSVGKGIATSRRVQQGRRVTDLHIACQLNMALTDIRDCRRTG